MKQLDIEQLDDFQTWATEWEPPLDVDGVLVRRIKTAGAAAVADLMCPRLIEVRGAVLLERNFTQETFDHWWNAHPGNLTAIEGVLNHVHLWDMFQPRADAEYRVIEQLAERMLICWRAAAAAQFPDRAFEIELTDDFGPTLTLVTAPQ